MGKPVRHIEVFRPGTFTPMNGAPVTLTADDLRTIAAAYDPDLSPAPAVVGHPRTDDPAFGWATEFTFDEERQRLVAGVGDLEPAFADAVQAKRYRRISLSLFRPTDPNNPKPGAYYPKHIGFLGAAAPAVTGLKPVAFAAADDDLTIEFGDAGFRDVAQAFRRIREWIIATAGLKTADDVLPDWTIGWIDARADEPDADDLPKFAAPAAPAHRTKEKPVSKPEDAAEFAAREARLTDREKALAAREAASRRAGHLAFAEGLVAEGKLLPVATAKTVELLVALDEVGGELSFAEGDATVKASPLEAFKALLQAQPKVVNFGKADLSQGDTPAADFAAPEGAEVDRDGLEILAKAQAFQRANPKLSFADAVKQAGGR